MRIHIVAAHKSVHSFLFNLSHADSVDTANARGNSTSVPSATSTTTIGPKPSPILGTSITVCNSSGGIIARIVGIVTSTASIHVRDIAIIIVTASTVSGTFRVDILSTRVAQLVPVVLRETPSDVGNINTIHHGSTTTRSTASTAASSAAYTASIAAPVTTAATATASTATSTAFRVNSTNLALQFWWKIRKTSEKSQQPVQTCSSRLDQNQPNAYPSKLTSRS
jgi:hypothetical protein